MKERRCGEDDCERLVKARGLCGLHYQRALATGLVIPAPRRDTCEIDDCDHRHFARGLCRKHYTRLGRHGDPLGAAAPRAINTCEMDDCDRPIGGHGLCRMHYQRWRRHGDPSIGRINARQVRLCLIDGCVKVVATAGLCNGHYLRWRRHGDPLGGSRLASRYESADDAFDGQTVWTVDGCLLWLGARCQGYGLFTYESRSEYSHRWSYERAIAPIPDHLVLDHVCHTLDLSCRGGRCRHRLCVNPVHLEPVTPRENLLRSYRRSVS